MSEPGRGLLLTRDLFFSSKVVGTARALGFAIDVDVGPAEAAARIAGGGYRCLIVDLGLPGLDLERTLPAMLERGGIRAVAFGSHVETDLLEAARRAGCDDVLPRSRFSATLPELLRNLLGGES